MDLVSNKIRREQLMRGDHIYSWRSGYSYSHHGIYVGEGKVIHMTRRPGLIVFSSTTRNRSGDPVVCCSIDEFLSGGDLYCCEYGVSLARYLTKRGGSCSLTPCDAPEDVLHRATFLLEKGFGKYHLFHTNCEEFATYCKTGLLKVDVSQPTTNEQIKFLGAVTYAAIFTTYRLLPTSFACLSLAFCASYSVFRLTSDAGVKKVPVEQFGFNYHYTILIRKSKTERSLSTVDNIAHALIGLRLWSWSPANRFLLWVRFVCLNSMLREVLSSYLRNRHKLRLGEHIVYIIQVLGSWYWRSEGIIFLFHRMVLLGETLKLLVTDEPTRLKRIEDNMSDIMWVLVYWNWTPDNTILQLIRLVTFHAHLNVLGSRHQIYHRLRLPRLFSVCLKIHLVALVLPWITEIFYLCKYYIYLGFPN